MRKQLFGQSDVWNAQAGRSHARTDRTLELGGSSAKVLVFICAFYMRPRIFLGEYVRPLVGNLFFLNRWFITITIMGEHCLVLFLVPSCRSLSSSSSSSSSSSYQDASMFVPKSRTCYHDIKKRKTRNPCTPSMESFIFERILDNNGISTGNYNFENQCPH